MLSFVFTFIGFYISRFYTDVIWFTRFRDERKNLNEFRRIFPTRPIKMFREEWIYLVLLFFGLKRS